MTKNNRKKTLSLYYYLFSVLAILAISISSVPAELINYEAKSAKANPIITPVPFITIDKGTNSYYNSGWYIRGRPELSGVNLVIRDEETWDTFWRKHSQGVKPKPEIDFRFYEVYAVMMGRCRSTGYRINVEIILEKWGIYPIPTAHRFVKVQNYVPSDDTVVIWVLTTPYHIVKVRKSNLGVFFYETEREESPEGSISTVYQPDLIIDGKGNDIYEPVPTHRQTSIKPKETNKLKYNLIIQNDGNVVDTIIVTAISSPGIYVFFSENDDKAQRFPYQVTLASQETKTLTLLVNFAWTYPWSHWFPLSPAGRVLLRAISQNDNTKVDSWRLVIIQD
jgi:hypothetical protein